MLLPGSTIYFGTWNGTLLVNTPVGVVTARSVTTPVLCPTIFSPLKLMAALIRMKQLGGTSMTAQETTIRHDPQTPPADSTTKRIFMGPNGLRAGWRLLIFIAIILAMSNVARLILKRFYPDALDPEQLTPLRVIAPDLIVCFILAVAAWTMSKIERRRPGEYGLPKSAALRKNFWVGVLIGLLATSTTVLAIFALHGVRFTTAVLHGTAIFTAAAAWGLAFLLAGFAEEFLFRGYAQFTLTTGMGFWPSAFLLSGLFGLAHASNGGEAVLGDLSVVSFGLLLCLFLRRTGNLWCAVGFHLGYDWGQTFLYGVPNSGLLPSHNLLNASFSGPRWLTGGTVGPEASIFCPIVLAIVAIVFSLKYRDARYRP
ncbi:MAG: type II CAAX endopeptidase family protein, partial [Candidatus Acidiferrum sp.]